MHIFLQVQRFNINCKYHMKIFDVTCRDSKVLDDGLT